MSKFERWILKRIIRMLVKQGPMHRDNILELYLLIRFACVEEFSEETPNSLKDFLSEIFIESQNVKPTYETIYTRKLIY